MLTSPRGLRLSVKPLLLHHEHAWEPRAIVFTRGWPAHGRLGSFQMGDPPRGKGRLRWTNTLWADLPDNRSTCTDCIIQLVWDTLLRTFFPSNVQKVFLSDGSSCDTAGRSFGKTQVRAAVGPKGVTARVAGRGSPYQRQMSCAYGQQCRRAHPGSGSPCVAKHRPHSLWMLGLKAACYPLSHPWGVARPSVAVCGHKAHTV